MSHFPSIPILDVQCVCLKNRVPKIYWSIITFLIELATLGGIPHFQTHPIHVVGHVNNIEQHMQTKELDVNRAHTHTTSFSIDGTALMFPSPCGLRKVAVKAVKVHL